MIEWSEQHLMIRDTLRRFVQEEIVVVADAAEAGVFLPVCPGPVNELYTAIWAELTK